MSKINETWIVQVGLKPKAQSPIGLKTRTFLGPFQLGPGMLSIETVVIPAIDSSIGSIISLNRRQWGALARVGQN